MLLSILPIFHQFLARERLEIMHFYQKIILQCNCHHPFWGCPFVILRKFCLKTVDIQFQIISKELRQIYPQLLIHWIVLVWKFLWLWVPCELVHGNIFSFYWSHCTFPYVIYLILNHWIWRLQYLKTGLHHFYQFNHQYPLLK